MSEELQERSARDPAPAVSRSLRLLEILAEAGKPMTLTELARELVLAKSSTANLCLALEAGRMIDHVPSGYRLGIRTAELGGAFASQFNQVREFYGVCERSPVLSSELVQVAILDGREALYIARYEGSRSARFGTPLGSRLPAALSATGRALLMVRDDATVVELLAPSTSFPTSGGTGTLSLESLLVKLHDARERGWTIDKEESFRGMVGVAVPVAGWAPGDPQLALGVGIPAAEAVKARIDRAGEALCEAAVALTNPFSAESSR